MSVAVAASAGSIVDDIIPCVDCGNIQVGRDGRSGISISSGDKQQLGQSDTSNMASAATDDEDDFTVMVIDELDEVDRNCGKNLVADENEHADIADGVKGPHLSAVEHVDEIKPSPTVSANKQPEIGHVSVSSLYCGREAIDAENDALSSSSSQSFDSKPAVVVNITAPATAPASVKSCTTAKVHGTSASKSKSMMLSLADGPPPLLVVQPSVGGGPKADSLSSVRPMAKLLQDTGLLLASEKVFKYLVQIQRQKVIDDKSGDGSADVQLLTKLESSYSNIVNRNTDFGMEPVRKCSCGFQSESQNVLQWHRLCGEWGTGKCCMCNGEFAYKNRGQFERHVQTVHNRTAQHTGRPPVYSCQTCSTDLGSRTLMKQHEAVCKRQFVLSQNQAPRQIDEDFPLKPGAPVAKPVAPTHDMRIIVNVPVPVVPVTPVINRLTVRSIESPGSVSSANVVKPSCVVTKPQFTPSIQPSSGKASRKTVACTTASAASLSNASSSSSLPSSSKGRMSSKQLLNFGGQLFSILTDGASSGAEARTQLSVAASKGKQNPYYEVCPLCNGFVRDDNALEVHMRVVHGLVTSTEAIVCWKCPDRGRVSTKQFLTHMADKHGVTLSNMLHRRQCSFCSSLPTARGVGAFEHHMLTVHAMLFASAEALWQVIEKSLPKRHHVRYSPDGTLQCRRCASNFISRAFLCRHAYMSHGGSTCTCAECKATDTTHLPQSSRSETDATVVIIDDDDDEDEIASKKTRMSAISEPVKVQQLRDDEQSLQKLLDHDGSLMDKIEEVLEIDGETVLIVQGDDDDDDGDDIGKNTIH
jgi:hypothetical protein